MRVLGAGVGAVGGLVDDVCDVVGWTDTNGTVGLEVWAVGVGVGVGRRGTCIGGSGGCVGTLEGGIDDMGEFVVLWAG